MPDTHDPEQYLEQAYLGEIRGEATFRALADIFPDRAEDLHLLAEVERVTAAYLRPHLRSPVAEATLAERRAEGMQRVVGFESWPAFLEGATQVVDHALALFKAAEAHAPEDLLEVYQTFSAHEQALADYLMLERNGQDSTHVLEDYIGKVSPSGA